MILASQFNETVRVRAVKYLLSRHLVSTIEDAEDATQDAFLSAWKHRKEFAGRSKFSSWFMRIAINAAKMRWRCAEAKTTRTLEPEAFERFTAKEKYQTDYFLRTEVLKAVNRLTPIERQTVIELYLRERSIKEVAALLSIPFNRVKMRSHRAKTKLRRLLTTNGIH